MDKYGGVEETIAEAKDDVGDLVPAITFTLHWAGSSIFLDQRETSGKDSVQHCIQISATQARRLRELLDLANVK